VVAAINPEKDVDGFHPDSPYAPATPGGIMKYLRACEFDLTGKDVVIIGRSNIVGKPLAAMMTDADATVTLCHSKSKLSHHLYSADLIVTAVGKAGFLNCYPIHVPVIDVGINFDENGKLVGDCFNTEGRDVTPVPGGVGLLTRCALLDNVIEAKARKCLKRG
jgi:methylenetetrahydrofolate dehydrogenase (NADP+)/methenyltetrahydrofolate cyclohydrolase